MHVCSIVCIFHELSEVFACEDPMETTHMLMWRALKEKAEGNLTCCANEGKSLCGHEGHSAGSSEALTAPVSWLHMFVFIDYLQVIELYSLSFQAGINFNLIHVVAT